MRSDHLKWACVCLQLCKLEAFCNLSLAGATARGLLLALQRLLEKVLSTPARAAASSATRAAGPRTVSSTLMRLHIL